MIIEAFAPKGKTKDTIELLNSQKVHAEARVLLVVDAKNDEIRRATNNLNQVKVVSAMYLNVFDILNADNIIMTKSALDVVKTWLGKETK